MPPAVQDHAIWIFPGETLWIEADFAADGTLLSARSVNEPSDPKRTLTLRFTQSPDLADGTDMMLEIAGPLDRPLKYRLGMMPLDKEALYKTSSCPVLPGTQAIEHWPFPIFQLVLTDLRLLGDGEHLTCE